MNTSTGTLLRSASLVAAAVAATLLTACASAPAAPDGASAVREKLTRLQSDPDLASRATPAIKDAEVAVKAAEAPERDEAVAAHRVFMADRKVETARAGAETRFAEDQRSVLSEQRERSRLDARTREADAANAAAASARADSEQQRLAADDARSNAVAAQDAARSAERQASDLQAQIDELNARPTDRGLVLTLGDVLFTSGQAELKASASGNLNKLIAFLNEYPERTVMIEGFTDSVGTEDFNQGLSERRAESVKTYLVGQGIGRVRLTALGKGESSPVADNGSADGRQQNRRVDVIIVNPPAAAR